MFLWVNKWYSFRGCKGFFKKFENYKLLINIYVLDVNVFMG